ncbi:MAG TPA: organomercurial lyase [Acidimicrobiia bacterium]|nr:organomercurial lyase [Acidimicrobiia bacterium]
MTDTTLIESWAEAVTDASPDLDDDGKRIAISTYRLLAGGSPVTTAQVAEAAGVPVERVEETLSSWPLVLRDSEDRIVGFWGIHVDHIEPTHAMTVDGTTVYGWCALDTLFIPEILDQKVEVRSSDPVDGTEIRVTISPEGLTNLEPTEAVVSFLLPDEEGFTDDAIARFCHKIYFFASPRSAEEWIGDRSGVYQVPVGEAFQLAKAINRHRLNAIDQARAPEQTG